MSSWRVSSSQKPRSSSVRGSGLSRLFEFALYATVATSPWTGIQVRSVPLADIAAVAAAVLLMLVWIVTRLKVAIPAWVVLPSAGSLVVLGADFFGLTGDPYVASSGIGVISSEDVLVLVRTLVATLVLFVLVSAFIQRYSVQRARVLLKVFCGSVLASVLVAIYTEISGVVLLEPPDIVVAERAVGLAFHPNSLAQTIVIALPALFLVAATASRRVLAAFGTIGSLVLLTWGLQLADSRGGLLGGAVIVVLGALWFLAQWRSGRFFVPTVVLGLVVALPVWNWVTSETRLGSASGAGTEQSTAGRVDLLALGVDLFRDAPLFGAGLDSGAGVMVPVLLLSGGGVVLLSCFTLYILGAARTVWTRPSVFPRFLALLAVVAPVLMGFFNNSVNERFDYVVLAVVAAAALHVEVRTDSPPSIEAGVPSGWRVGQVDRDTPFGERPSANKQRSGARSRWLRVGGGT